MFTVESVAPALARCPGTGTASASVVSLAPPCPLVRQTWSTSETPVPRAAREEPELPEGWTSIECTELVAIIAAACLLAATWLFVGTWWVVTLSWLAH
jgi:hypothetical protein